MNPLNRFLLLIVRLYQKFLSPLKNLILNNPNGSCRFSPTCSQYAVESLKTHGFFVALSLIVFRILRCNPFSKGGSDPVPLHPFSNRAFTVWFISSYSALAFLCAVSFWRMIA